MYGCDRQNVNGKLSMGVGEGQWEAELVSEWTGLSGRATSVKRFERSNGLDTALYKTNFFLTW